MGAGNHETILAMGVNIRGRGVNLFRLAATQSRGQRGLYGQCRVAQEPRRQ